MAAQTHDRRGSGLLPGAVYDLAIRLGVDPETDRSIVRLNQNGRMKLPVGAIWAPFRATQTISVRNCTFDWRARFGPFGMFSVCDSLTSEAARLAVTALGSMPIMTARSSPILMRGELMRYLAELAWAPDAILLNPNLRWREDGPETLLVSAGVEDRAAEVTLTLDSNGRIAGAFAPDRCRSVKPPYLPTPWRGRFSDYRQHESVWLPFAGEVAWQIEDREQTYWQGKIESWSADEIDRAV